LWLLLLLFVPVASGQAEVNETEVINREDADPGRALGIARREISARDEWFRIHVDQLRGIGKAIDERDTLIEGAKSKKIKGDYKATLEKLNVPDDVSKPNI